MNQKRRSAPDERAAKEKDEGGTTTARQVGRPEDTPRDDVDAIVES